MLFVDYASVDEDARPDFAAAKAAGVRGVIIRADYQTWEDPTWKRDHDDALKAGLMVAPYIFPVTTKGHPTPTVQVAAMRKATGPLGRGYLPAVIDIEFPQGIAATGHTRAELVEWLEEAEMAMVEAYGVKSMIYTSGRVIDATDTDTLGHPLFKQDMIECPLWLSHYGPLPTNVAAIIDRGRVDAIPWPHVPTQWGDSSNCWLHQYQGDATHFPGFSHTVDISRFRVLGPGMTGDRVRWVQRRLDVAQSGIMDEVTVNTIKELQTDEGLTVDGIIGPMTFSVICWKNR